MSVVLSLTIHVGVEFFASIVVLLAVRHGVCGRDVIFLMFGVTVLVLLPVSIGIGVAIGSGGASSGGVV